MYQAPSAVRITTHCALVSILSLSPLAMAGKATVTSEDGNTAQFEYRDEMLRIGNQDSDSYMLVRDNNMYVVATDNGTPMVFDAGSMMKGMTDNMTQVAPSSLQSEFISLTETGRQETVAGIEGDIWELTFRDDDGRTQTEELVLSTDARAIELRDALFSMSRVAAEFTEERDDEGQELLARMDQLDAGVLRYGNSMTVSAISDETVPESRFALPAEPVDMGGLGAAFGSITPPSNPESSESSETAPQPEDEGDTGSGGLFSRMMGALGEKTEEKGNRAEDAVEREVDERTDGAVDSAIDSAVDKAFGKLFGE